MSVEGVYTLSFGNPSDELGAGILIFETQRAFGGDSNFSFVGDYQINNLEVSGSLSVKRHSGGMPDVYNSGDDEFSVDFQLLTTAHGMSGQFHRTGYPSGVCSLKKIAELP